jgi:hypothetical protein
MAEVVEMQTPEIVLRRDGLARRLGWMATLSSVAPCVASMAIPAGLEPIGPLLLAAMAASPLFALVALALRWPRRRRDESVRIADGRLTLGTGAFSRRIALREIEHGWLLPGVPDRVEWTLRDGSVVRVDVADPRDAERLLAASGVDIRRNAVSVRLGSGPGLFALGALGFVVSICPATMIAAMFERSTPAIEGLRGPIWLAMITAGIATTVALFAPPRVVVGADGIAIERTYGTRFIPFGDIAQVINDPLEIILALKSGRVFRIPLSEIPLDQRRGLARRISDAMGATRWRVDAGVADEVLERNGRSLAEWRAALATILRGNESYRSTAIRGEDLARVLDDPAAPSERRIGAALALAGGGGNEGIDRVRVAARACASQPLRVALEHVADDVLEAADLAEVVERRGRTSG